MVEILVLLGRFSAMLLARDEKSSVGCTSSLNWPSRPRNRSIIVGEELEGLDTGCTSSNWGCWTGELFVCFVIWGCVFESFVTYRSKRKVRGKRHLGDAFPGA